MTNAADKQQVILTSTYAIPKRWVWCAVAIISFWLMHAAYDKLIHQNWPPADRSNRKLIEGMSLNCKEKNNGRTGFVTQEALDGKPERIGAIPLGFDRQDFIDAPECMGVRLYLIYEGSGIREEFDIYDMSKKTKTAHIVITHEKFDHQ